MQKNSKYYFELGKKYEEGNGVPQDKGYANYCYRKAKEMAEKERVQAENAVIISEEAKETKDTPLTGQEEKYAKEYSDDKFKAKTSTNAKSIGRELLIKAFELYYLIKSDKVPVTVKALAVAGLGYLISPIDLVPDIIPVLGYGDDAAVIASILVMMAEHIDQEIIDQATKAVDDILG
ncbi:MAG: DUF1232 domain-containing protein [Phascolarctobacterium sp.]|nr:DUF1232 domain-containing protein [Phascolarctobacterium sp.]